MTRWWLILAMLVAACGGGDNPATPDGPPGDALDPDVPPDADPLDTLLGTGLCVDAACTTISPDVIEYEPRFPLYSDGATKRRWFQLPAGSKIDTTNMDRWVFPVGTKFWKEFTRDGTRVETRFITKVLTDDDAPNAWQFLTYEWNATQDATTKAPNTGVMDANGTDHNIPSKGQCKECHDGLRPSRVLGFQAIQLDYNSTLIDLEDLISQNLLTAPPTSGTAGARFPLPGLAVDKTALGYLHANCGHCHNTSSSTHDTVDLELRLEIGELGSVQSTGAFKSAVNTAADPCNGTDDDGDGRIDNGCPDQTLTIDGTTYPFMIVPGDTVNSGLLQRMKTTGIRRMPKIAVEIPDPLGDTVINDWIDSL